MGVCTPLRPQNILRMMFSREFRKRFGTWRFSVALIWVLWYPANVAGG